MVCKGDVRGQTVYILDKIAASISALGGTLDDVVRTRIESLGGHMRILSRFGEGTEIEMVLPLTVAVIDSLLLRLGPDLYAVPIHSVQQTLEVHPDQVRSAQVRPAQVRPLQRHHRGAGHDIGVETAVWPDRGATASTPT